MGLHFRLFNDKELKQMDALKESYGGASEIMSTIKKKREFEERKKIATEHGFGEMIEQAEEFAKSFAKLEDFL